MVSWTRSTQPLLLGLPARMKRCLPPRRWTVAPKSLARNSEPLSVVTSPSFQPAAASSAATRCNSWLVWRELGLRSVACSSAQQNAEATSMAVYCQTVPLVPLNLAAPRRRRGSRRELLGPARHVARLLRTAQPLRAGPRRARASPSSPRPFLARTTYARRHSRRTND